jgi:hypothetical protein
MRVGLEELAQCFSQDAHAATVDNPNAGESGEEGAVDEFFDLAGGLVHSLSNDVDFAWDSGIFSR